MMKLYNSAIDRKSVTVSHVFGEIVWLLSQSSKHADVSAKNMSWLIIPPIILRQFHIFREGSRPIGAAIWAKLDAQAEKRLRIEESSRNPIADSDWSSGDTTWLIDLISPFSSKENRQHEIMIADLLSGPLKNQSFNMIIDGYLSQRTDIVSFPADAGSQLISKINEALNG